MYMCVYSEFMKDFELCLSLYKSWSDNVFEGRTFSTLHNKAAGIVAHSIPKNIIIYIIIYNICQSLCHMNVRLDKGTEEDFISFHFISITRFTDAKKVFIQLYS